MCRVAPQFNQDPPANALCLIVVNDSIVTISHRWSGQYDLPGGTNSANESAQCTAHRETWEETGFNVEVGRKLGNNENGTHIYHCRLAGNFTGQVTEFPVPEWATNEVSSIQLVDPFETLDNQWRFPDQLISLRQMFNQAHSEN